MHGRRDELDTLREILRRRRWFFLKVSGRRRIGKTSLVQQALQAEGHERVLYIQVPDSDPAGVVATARDFYELFRIDVPQPTDLRSLASSIGDLVRRGYVVAIDEFQYFHRKALFEFTSHLQLEVDRLARDPAQVQGGLVVLGSIHTEMSALLEDRTAPLFARLTHSLDVPHLDIASVLEILRKLFFSSSSPLRTEAENWFLRELRGRYDLVLKYIARQPGCTNGQIHDHARSVEPDAEKQIGGYVKVLRERYRMVEQLQPVFAKSTTRNGRYYISDNFLRSWLAALSATAASVNFRPVDELVREADQRLADAEGHGFERLVATLYEERSRKGLEGFRLTQRVQGFWDRGDTEIDLVALNEHDRVVRLGTCKRSAGALAPDFAGFDAHVARFLKHTSRVQGWRVEKAAIATRHSPDTRLAAGRRLHPSGSRRSDCRPMSDAANHIVQKLWSYCNVLRDDGLSYQDYLEQLTFLLFLKMADERARLTGEPQPIPEGFRWADLAAPQMEDVELIGKENWSAMSADVKGDAYEGLLERNAQDTKSGAGQYFTPRVLIDAIVDCVRPQPGEVVADPACGTGGFLLSAHEYVKNHFELDRDQKRHLRFEALRGTELVPNVVACAG